MVQEIAQMQTPHSWLKEIMLLPQEKSEKAETKVNRWVIKKLGKDNPANRIVREVYPLFLEAEAIAAFKEQNPQFLQVIPEVNSAQEAAEVGAMEVMYATQEEIDQAAAFLQEMSELKSMPV